jgi:hypothetical protein
MNAINYRVSLDMFDVSSQITIKAKKGDSACKIYITLAENGKIYKITDGCTATFSAKKADGNFVYHDCTIENNTIVYDFASSIDEEGACQISACEGNVECEVTLYKDNEQLTSSRFTLVVDSTVYSGEDINSSESIKGVKEVIDRANELVDEIETKLENGEFNGKDGEITNLDQTYSPESENAQSGKAVAVAVSGCVQKVNGNTMTDQVYAVDSTGNQQTIGVEDVGMYEVGGHNFGYAIPRRKTNGNLMTHTPETELDCANKKYVDDKSDWAVHFLAHTAFKVPSLNVFRKATVELYLDNCTDLREFCVLKSEEQRNTTVKHLILNNAKITGMNMTNMLDIGYTYRDMTLKRLTINFDTSETTWFNYVFGALSALEIIDGQPLNLSKVTVMYNPFNYDYELREVRFVENTIGINITFAHCSLLSDETIQSIIYGLKDLTGGTSQTLTLHKTVGNKLTDTQKATITAKNWTLVY